MIVIAWVFAIPLAYAATLTILALKRDPRGIVVSLILLLAAFASGWWGIKQSRASTAGIGFVFLPLTATVAGFLGLAFGRWRDMEEPVAKIGAWLALICAAAIVALNIREGVKTIAKNKTRDDFQNNFAAQ